MHFPGVALLSQGFPVMEPTSNYMQLVGMMVHYCVLKEVETGEPWTLGLNNMILGMKKEAGDNRRIMEDFRKNFKPLVTFYDNVSDAMAYFDEGNKLAGLSKKEMRVLRRIAGDDPDAGELLEIARRVARKRVVVKRHRRGPPLAPQPDLQYRGKQVRYDVYLPLPPKRPQAPAGR